MSSDPKQDHNYSSVPVQRCPSPSSSSSSSSSSLSYLDEGGRGARQQSRRAGSEGFHSDEDSDADAEPDAYPESPEPDGKPLRRSPHGRPAPPPPSLKAPASKRARREAKAELDEELKEAAGSLLHLAGIRTCLEATSNHAARSKKLSRK